MNEGGERRMESGVMHLHFKTINDKLDNITTKVENTNGRVQSLERWRMFIMGGLTILTLLFVPVVFLMIRQWLISPH